MYIRRDELKTAEKEWQKIIWGYFWGYIGKQDKNKTLNINKLKLTFCSCWDQVFLTASETRPLTKQ